MSGLVKPKALNSRSINKLERLSLPVTLPLPTTLFQITWTIIGFIFARAFGKKLDQDIQKSDCFKRLSEPWQNIVKRLLDFLHHFYMGLLLMIYFPQTSEIHWAGLGLFIDDIPDIPSRFKGFFAYKGWFKE